MCPLRSSSCASTGRPNACCADGTTCWLVQDTGLGDVGRCQLGSTCGAGGLVSCDTSVGYVACTGGPGCCLSGYTCTNIGCDKATGTATTVISSAQVITTLAATPTPAISGDVSSDHKTSIGGETTAIGRTTSTTSPATTRASASTPTTTKPTDRPNPDEQTLLAKQGNKIAVGVGLGIAVPALLISLVTLYLQYQKRRGSYKISDASTVRNSDH